MRTYFNPVHGQKGVFGGDRPEFLTREELIGYAAESAIGESYGIADSFNSFLEWIGEVDFCYADLTMRELELVDEIVFTCDWCGWSYSADEKHYNNNGDVCCADCAEDEVED